VLNKKTYCLYSFRMRFLLQLSTYLWLLHGINPMVFCAGLT